MAGTFYRTLDHLGSTRLITDQNGVDVSRHNFFPFGGEIPSTSGGTRNQVPTYNQPKGISQKCTGKERDDESKLDYFLARYYSAPMGRFLSVDPDNADATLDDPRSWNAYAYTRNSPLGFVDPDGQIVLTASGIAALSLGACAVGATTRVAGRAVSFRRGPRTRSENRKLLLSAARGCVQGVVGGLVLFGLSPVSVPVTVGSVAVIAAGTGAGERALDLDPRTHPLDPIDSFFDSALSFISTDSGSAGVALEALKVAIEGEDEPVEEITTRITYFIPNEEVQEKKDEERILDEDEVQ